MNRILLAGASTILAASVLGSPLVAGPPQRRPRGSSAGAR